MAYFKKGIVIFTVAIFLGLILLAPVAEAAPRQRAVRVPSLAWFLDRDGDGYGDPGSHTSGTLAPAVRMVRDGSDCNDANAYVYRLVSGGTDADRDSYIAGRARTGCVGDLFFIESEPVAQNNYYYRDAEGQYTWLEGANSLGYNDCNDANMFLHRALAGGVDADRDGYVAGKRAILSCVGAGRTIFGRTYYPYPSSFIFLDGKDILGYSDRNDQNAGVH